MSPLTHRGYQTTLRLPCHELLTYHLLVLHSGRIPGTRVNQDLGLGVCTWLHLDERYIHTGDFIFNPAALPVGPKFHFSP